MTKSSFELMPGLRFGAKLTIAIAMAAGFVGGVLVAVAATVLL